MKKNILILLMMLTIIAASLRFYNLNWGAPYYFHPDERNIASSVSQIKFPDQMNPRFFAYGSLPIYTIYFTGLLLKLQPINTQISFETAIIVSRLYSAFFSSVLIPLMFFIGKKLKNTTTGLLAAFLITFSTGFIQFAHFGTFELWLTFFTLLLFWLCLKLLETKKTLYIFLLALISGILIAVKISHLALLPIPILLLLYINKTKNKPKFTNFLFILIFLKQTIYFLTIAGSIYLLTNPYVSLDEKSFIGSMKYESEVALGTLPVFYTGAFTNTIPVIYQFLNVYPFLLNPILTILFIPAFFYLLYLSIKTKNPKYLLLITCYIILLTSQAFLYVKWTRYMLPTLPFIYLIISIVYAEIIIKHKKLTSIIPPPLLKGAGGIFLATAILFALSYFITAFIRPDTRISAKNYAKLYIRSDTPILSEVYDLGITPFNDSFSNIKLFNFYDLDNNSPELTQATLSHELANANYLILPSQRILQPRLQNPQSFPNGYKFYSDLFTAKTCYQKIYETPCDLLCRITYLNSPIFAFEQTSNVFDRPTVFIFMKIKN